jgi:hypothetical protein
MDPHRVQRVSSRSWFGRLGDAAKGVVFGLLLFLIGFPLLFWNEGSSVRRHRALAEGAAAVVEASADQIDLNDDGALVHVTGVATADDPAEDAEFGVSSPSLKLRRRVEMYQWREEKDSDQRDKLGGGTETVTTYEYRKDWSSSLADSRKFEMPEGHQNPATMPFPSRDFAAPQVRLGAFRLTGSQLSALSEFEPVSLPAGVAPPLALGERATRTGNGFHVGDPTAPQVGDLRIRYEAVAPGSVSIVARQVGDGFEPYRTSAGGEIELVSAGIHSAASMFEGAVATNRFLTWLIRLGGFMLMFFGMTLVLKPLTVVADVVPIFGAIVETGTTIIALLIAAPFALATISMAWLFYRPLIGVPLMIAAIGLGIVLWRKLRAAKAVTRAPASP